MNRIEKVVLSTSLLVLSTPAFAGDIAPVPAPAVGIGVGAVVLIGLGYRALKRHIKP